VVDALVVRFEGGAVEPTKGDRGVHQSDRELELDAEHLGDAHGDDGTQLEAVELLVVELGRFVALEADRPDIGAAILVHDVHGGPGEAERDGDLGGRERCIADPRVRQVRVGATCAGLRCTLARGERGQREREDERRPHG
jgi:hypothetical protein